MRHRLSFIIATTCMVLGSSLPASAALNAGLCRSIESRGAVPKDFAIEACFDGQQVKLRNTLKVPVRIDASQDVKRIATSPVIPTLTNLVVSRFTSDAVLVPGQEMTLRVGTAALDIDVAPTAVGTALAAYFADLALKVLTGIPGTIINVYDAVADLIAELTKVYEDYLVCIQGKDFFGTAGCAAGFGWDVDFAVKRVSARIVLAVGAQFNVPLKIANTVVQVVETGLDAKQLVEDASKLVTSSPTFHISAHTPSTLRVAPPAEQPKIRVPSPGSPPQQNTPTKPKPAITTTKPTTTTTKPRPTTTSTRTNTPASPIVFRVSGSCTTDGGVLGSTSSGFTPGNRYTIEAWYPNGAPYTNLTLGNAGTVRPDGSISWQWDCTGDPPGTYTTRLTDVATGRTTGKVAFTVGRSASGQVPTPSSSTSTTSTPSRCTTFTVYAQNRWDPQGAARRVAPDHTSAQSGGFAGNAPISVNGWTSGTTPYPQNPPPFNNNIWYRLADGSGWVSFPGTRATPTSYAPQSADGGPPSATPQACRI